MSLPAFTQHLGVLERGGLVRSTKKGRVRTYTLTPEALRPVETWLDEQRRVWNARLDQLDSYLQLMRALPDQPPVALDGPSTAVAEHLAEKEPRKDRR